MTTITTVRAALAAVAGCGWTQATRYQLGAAMGPARLYALSLAGPDGSAPLLTGESASRRWLQVFTEPDSLILNVGRVVQRQLRYAELTGAALLGLAHELGCGLTLDAGTALECRIPAKDLQALHVAASYTESLARTDPPEAGFSPAPAMRIA